MIIKVHYDSKSGDILGFYPDSINYPCIPEPNIEINEDTWQDCFENQRLRAVDIKNKKIITVAPSAPTKEQLLTQIRFTRNKLLAASDWTQLPDNTLTAEQKVDWAKYRQELRDMPTACDPYNPVYPVSPE
jgi:hypothetical protein